jgi:hypothetical protein
MPLNVPPVIYYNWCSDILLLDILDLFLPFCLSGTVFTNLLLSIFSLTLINQFSTNKINRSNNVFENVGRCTSCSYMTLYKTDKRLILVNDQLDAHFVFLICLFQSCTCFEQPRAHRQENQLYQYNVWFMSLWVGGRLVFRSGRISFLTCIPEGHLHRVTYSRHCIDTIDSSDDGYEVARNMYRIEISI